MSKGSEIHCYDNVNHPYEQVRDALTKDALAVFQSATKGAASRARSIASELRVEMGGIGVQADIIISIKKIDEKASEPMGAPVTRLQLEWESAKIPSPVSAHESGPLNLSIDWHRNAIGFLGRLRTTARYSGKGRECDRRPPHRRSFGSPLR